MAVYIGQIALWLALGISLLQVYPKPAFLKQSATAIFGMVVTAFVVLMHSYVVSDFTLVNVTLNSHTQKPLIYKITGVWGNHEGSMLLLVMILSLYNLLFIRSNPVEHRSVLYSVNVLGIILAGFLGFVIFTSNPFITNPIVPKEGLGLNPLLQDIGLALHPPILYMGYIGYAIVFAMSFGQLCCPRSEKLFARQQLPWVQFSWIMLTLGICLGSWWAYRELGWGGFWFWDPVENVSLMPWLVGTALLHTVIVLMRRGVFHGWSLFLGLLCFVLSLLGIFLVRSGILTSVHAFANDPDRGVYILGFIAFIGVLGFGTFGARASKLHPGDPFYILSKESAVLVNNILLLVACSVVLLGTIYPLIAVGFFDTHVSVGAPYYNVAVVYTLLPLLILAYIGSVLRWQKDTLSRIKARMVMPSSVSVLCIAFSYLFGILTQAIVMIFIFLAMWLLLGMLFLLLRRVRFLAYPLRDNWKVMRKQTYGFFAMIVSHIGFAVLVLGITFHAFYSEEKEYVLQEGEKVFFSEYHFHLRDMRLGKRDNYVYGKAIFDIISDSQIVTSLYPETRFYPTEKTKTIEAAVDYGLFRNLYIAIGDVDIEKGYGVRIYYHSMVNWIWIGCVLMALGALLSLMKKRYTYRD